LRRSIAAIFNRPASTDSDACAQWVERNIVSSVGRARMGGAVPAGWRRPMGWAIRGAAAPAMLPRNSPGVQLLEDESSMTRRAQTLPPGGAPATRAPIKAAPTARPLAEPPDGKPAAGNPLASTVLEKTPASSVGEAQADVGSGLWRNARAPGANIRMPNTIVGVPRQRPRQARYGVLTKLKDLDPERHSLDPKRRPESGVRTQIGPLCAAPDADYMFTLRGGVGR